MVHWCFWLKFILVTFVKVQNFDKGLLKNYAFNSAKLSFSATINVSIAAVVIVKGGRILNKFLLLAPPVKMYFSIIIFFLKALTSKSNSTPNINPLPFTFVISGMALMASKKYTDTLFVFSISFLSSITSKTAIP